MPAVLCAGRGADDGSGHDAQARESKTATLCPLRYVQGAVQTMAVAMMRKPENRAAAVTMLGKTVDLAGHLVRKICVPNPPGDDKNCPGKVFKGFQMALCKTVGGGGPPGLRGSMQKGVAKGKCVCSGARWCASATLHYAAAAALAPLCPYRSC